MNKLIVALFVFVSAFSCSLKAEEIDVKASADVERKFNVKSSYNETISWAEQNKSLIRDTMEVKVLKDFGNGKLKVAKQTPKGTFVWVMQEEIVQNKGQSIYKSKLVESVSGGLVYSDTWITLKPIEKGCSVHIRMAAGVSTGNITNKNMNFDLATLTGKCRKLIESELN
ncbi:MAG: hypothetical protein EKK64_03645 [Neisseriaceae bacterium]|nr:MAG: hypothetical protein EKK64_03645 [Neisseriaceae bacterium]